jgi:hypothetical protein
VPIVDRRGIAYRDEVTKGRLLLGGDVAERIILKEAVDGEFTTAEDVAEATLFFSAFESNALTTNHVSHG